MAYVIVTDSGMISVALAWRQYRNVAYQRRRSNDVAFSVWRGNGRNQLISRLAASGWRGGVILWRDLFACLTAPATCQCWRRVTVLVTSAAAASCGGLRRQQRRRGGIGGVASVAVIYCL